MGKRKQSPPGGPRFAIASYVAHLRNEEAAESRSPLQGNNDSSDAHLSKKQKTQKSSDPSRTDIRESEFNHEDLQIEQNLQSSARDSSPSKSSTQILNPFSTKNHDAANEGETDAMDATGSPAATGSDADAMDTQASPRPTANRNGEYRLRPQPRPSQSGRKGSKNKMLKKQADKSRDYPYIKYTNTVRLNSQVTLNNLQGLVLYLLADGVSPLWVAVSHKAAIQQVVVLLVPGLELGMFTGEIDLGSAAAEAADSTTSETPEDSTMDVEQPEHLSNPERLGLDVESFFPAKLKKDRLPKALRPLSEIFPHVFPVKGGVDHNGPQIHRVHSPIQSMLTSSIPKTREDRKMKKDKSHKGPLPQNTKNYLSKPTPITKFLANVGDQQENDFVIHPAWFLTPEAKEAALQHRVKDKTSAEFGWVDSNVESLEDGEVPEDEIEKGSTTVGRKILAVDCEFCKAEGNVDVLTRISLVGWDGKTVMDELVKPDVPIMDYVTQFSGITEAMLEDVTNTLPDVQKKLVDLLTPRTILVGHSLNKDLEVLKITHPFLIDTGILYPHPRGRPYKHGLKNLSQKYLHREIQKGCQGHDSVEDAVSCLDLVKQKCEHGQDWGTPNMNTEPIFDRLGRATRKPKTGTGPEYRKGAVVDWGYPERGFGGQAAVAIGCESDEEVVRKITSTANGQREVGDEDKTEDINFVWGRLRELEMLRCWWDSAKTDDVESLRTKAVHRLKWNEEEVTGSALGAAVADTVHHIAQVYDSLRPGTAFLVYSGTGNPREMARLQSMRRVYQAEYKVKNWDSLSVKWTDTEAQALSRACKTARESVAFVTVK